MRRAGSPDLLAQTVAPALGGASLQRGLRDDRKLPGLLPIKGLGAGRTGAQDAYEGDGKESEKRCDTATKMREKAFVLFRRPGRLVETPGFAAPPRDGCAFVVVHLVR